jgi:hypothetical protein
LRDKKIAQISRKKLHQKTQGVIANLGQTALPPK